MGNKGIRKEEKSKLKYVDRTQRGINMHSASQECEVGVLGKFHKYDTEVFQEGN